MDKRTHQEIVLVGGGGHAKVCIEIFHAMKISVAYCIGGMDASDYCLNVPVLEGDENLTKLRDAGYDKIFIAIGSNSLRKKLSLKAREHGYQLVNAIHPESTVSPSAEIGKGVAIMPGVIINAETVIEDLSIINTGTTVDHDCVIGECAHIAPGCSLAGNVDIGSECFLGVGCKVIPNIRIGKGATVGAGAVVVTNIDSYKKAIGIPAKMINQQVKE